MELLPNPRVAQMVSALYTHLATAAYGTAYTYAQLDAMLGANVRQYRWILYRVHTRLQRQAQRALSCERNIGYRVIRPNEHVDLAERHHGRSRRQLSKALLVLEATEHTLLTNAERLSNERLASTYRAIRNAFRHVELRQNTLEAEQRQQHETNETIVKRLERLEQRFFSNES